MAREWQGVEFPIFVLPLEDEMFHLTSCNTRNMIVGCLATLALAGCAGYGGSNLRPGESSLPEVIASMGVPAMTWKDPDGREQLAYPRGPSGTETFMVFIAPDGKLERIDKVLNMEHFGQIRSGESDVASVLRLLGPVPPQNIVYFKARDELVWSWLFCDSWSQQAFFDVLFDATSGRVRTTQQRSDLRGRRGITPSCGH